MNVLVVILAFWVPGLVLGTVLRLRGWTLAAAAPALTFGGIALGVVAFQPLGLRWTPLIVAGWFAALAVVLLALTLLVKGRAQATDPDDVLSPRRLTTRGHLFVGAGVAAGIGVGALSFLRGIGSLDMLNQDWDSPFHGNAVRWIAEHANATPSTLGATANLPNQADYFYPDTYHALLALLLERVGGLEMPQLLNLAALMGVIAFPLGVAALGVTWRLPAISVGAAAAVSTWFSTFPFDSLWRGPLWPYVAGLALVPAVLAVTRELFVGRGVGGPIALAIAAAGLVGLHTSLAFILAAYLGVILLAVLVKVEPIDWRRSWKPVVGAGALGAVFVVVMMLPALFNAGGVTSTIWPIESTPAEAFGQIMLFSPSSPFPQWWLGLCALIGLVLMFRHRRLLWLATSYVAFAVLYAATVSLESPLVHKITGPFYDDAWRFAALLSLAGAVAFGEFVWTVSQAAVRLRDRARPGFATAPLVAAGSAVAVVLVLVGLTGAYVNRNVTRLGIQYHDGPGVSRAEQEAYLWLAEHSKPGERVMNDLRDGSVWMYAIAGVTPVEWTHYGAAEGTQENLLSREFNHYADENDSEVRTEVRKAVRDLNVRYAVVGTGWVRPHGFRQPGLLGITSVSWTRVVFQNSDATVVELIGAEQSGQARPSTDGN